MKTYIISAVAVMGLLVARAGYATTENNSGIQDPAMAKAFAAATSNSLVLASLAPPIRLAPYRVRSDVPAATHILEPRIGSEFVGQEVEMRFTVDGSGRAYNIDSVSVMANPNLVTQLASAIAGWQFDPARDARGNIIERTVILPMVIVDPDENGSAEASPLITTSPDLPLQMAPYHVRTNPGEPAAIDVVTPRLSADFVNQKLELRFTVDTAGRPYNIEAITPNADANLVTQVAGAVWYWRFDPARDAKGIPMERSVILPVVIGPAK